MKKDRILYSLCVAAGVIVIVALCVSPALGVLAVIAVATPLAAVAIRESKAAEQRRNAALAELMRMELAGRYAARDAQTR